MPSRQLPPPPSPVVVPARRSARSCRRTCWRRSRRPTTRTSPHTPRPPSTSTPSCGRAARTSGLRADRRAHRGQAPRLGGSGTADGPVRAIHDAEHGTTLPGTLVRSEGDPDTGDREVTEAYDGLGGTWQLWQEAYGRNSLDGKGLPLVATVHFGTRLRQRLLGRHPDGLRRRRRRGVPAVHPQRRRHRPRAGPRGHPVHARA